MLHDTVGEDGRGGVFDREGAGDVGSGALE